MRIYLAGPLDGCDSDWRWSLLRQADGAQLVLCGGHQGGRHTPAWPQSPNTWILGEHEFVGPYQRVCCLGYPQEHLAAVARADLVFAWLGESAIHRAEDAEGQLVGQVDDSVLTDTVLGYARALGKYIFAVSYETARVEENWRSWFLGCQLADADAHVCHDHAARPDFEGLMRRALRQYGRACPRPSPVRDLREIREAFANIVKWTSDPRVRQEARGILRRLAVQSGGTGG